MTAEHTLGEPRFAPVILVRYLRDSQQDSSHSEFSSQPILNELFCSGDQVVCLKPRPLLVTPGPAVSSKRDKAHLDSPLHVPIPRYTAGAQYVHRQDSWAEISLHRGSGQRLTIKLVLDNVVEDLQKEEDQVVVLGC